MWICKEYKIILLEMKDEQNYFTKCKGHFEWFVLFEIHHKLGNFSLCNNLSQLCSRFCVCFPFLLILSCSQLSFSRLLTIMFAFVYFACFMVTMRGWSCSEVLIMFAFICFVCLMVAMRGWGCSEILNVEWSLKLGWNLDFMYRRTNLMKILIDNY